MPTTATLNRAIVTLYRTTVSSQLYAFPGNCQLMDYKGQPNASWMHVQDNFHFAQDKLLLYVCQLKVVLYSYKGKHSLTWLLPTISWRLAQSNCQLSKGKCQKANGKCQHAHGNYQFAKRNCQYGKGNCQFKKVNAKIQRMSVSLCNATINLQRSNVNMRG